MATQLQLRRGTTVENDGFTGALAEVTVDTDTHQLRVHDGSTQGGFIIPTESDMNTALGDKADASDVYDKATVDTALNAKAETDLSNITDGAKNVASWSTNMTNCVTETPQDIKLELNAGTLTLKAGSKVYVPNGVGASEEILITADRSHTIAIDDTYMIFAESDGSGILYRRLSSQTGSGTTTPTSGYVAYYNTSDNKIYKVDNGVVSGQASFPVAIVTVSGSAITSIDQVFNGFGYIGSTVFALPGAKGLIPNGRNTDGTLNNTVTNDYNTVKTVQVNTSTAKIAMYVGGGVGSQTNNFGLNEQENFNYDSGVLTNALEVARVIVDSNAKITAFTPKTVFHALDYNDTEYIAHQAMPNGKYINLTLGSTGASYIAPADGYICISKDSTAAGQWITIGCNNLGISGVAVGPGNDMTLTLPVKKGATVTVYYSIDGTTHYFRFIYAQGAA